jgi:hypothetical protein
VRQFSLHAHQFPSLGFPNRGLCIAHEDLSKIRQNSSPPLAQPKYGVRSHMDEH